MGHAEKLAKLEVWLQALVGGATGTRKNSHYNEVYYYRYDPSNGLISFSRLREDGVEEHIDKQDLAWYRSAYISMSDRVEIVKVVCIGGE